MNMNRIHYEKTIKTGKTGGIKTQYLLIDAALKNSRKIGGSKMKKWSEQRIEVQKCAQTIVKANYAGKQIPDEFYTAMKIFSPDEIEAIEAYVAYKTFCGEYAPGADYMTAEQMEEKMEEKMEKTEIGK